MEKMSSTKTFGDYRRDPETLQYVEAGTKDLTVTLEDSDNLIFSEKSCDGTREKKVSVKAGSDFIYEIKKTFIRARGGADGLFGFLSDPDCLGVYMSMFDKVFDYMK